MPRASFRAVKGGIVDDRLAPNYRLRPATAADAAFIFRVRAAGLTEHVARIWGWDEADQARRFAERYRPERYQIVVVDGRDVGAVSIEHRADEIFLADVELLPEYRGRGLGGAIVGAVVAEAEARGVPVTLQVFRTNPARRLYERLGFAIEAETETHYRMRTRPPALADDRGASGR
jgi:ribosomal protein S18 acetylase RimI-like enzyme